MGVRPNFRSTFIPNWANATVAARIVSTSLLLLCFFICCEKAHAQVSVEMTTDRTRISADETVVVQIRVEANGGEEPDIEVPPFDNFEIVQQNVSRPMQFSFSFGSNRGAQRVFRSTTQYVFVLRPLKEGTFVIPPVRVTAAGQTYKSRSMTVVVGRGSSPQPSGAQPPGAQSDPAQPADNSAQSKQNYVDATDFDQQAFLRTVVDKGEAYVGEQVTTTIYLYIRSRLTANPSIDTEPNTDGFWVHDLMQPQANLTPRRQVVKGIPFTVYALRRFAAFPLKNGDLSIGSMTVSIERNSLFDFFDRGVQPTLRRASVPVKINVKDLPDKNRPSSDVAVGLFSITAKLDREQVATGDAVKLTATVTGTGNVRTVSLADPKIDGVQILQPEIRDVIESPNDLVSGTRVYEWLLVPQKPGKIVIGTIGLPVFDPSQKKYQSVQSNPLTLTVVGRALQAEEEKAAATPEESTEQKPSTGNTFGPIRTSSALLRKPSRLVSAEWYFWALALGPLCWLTVLGVSSVRRRLDANSKKSAPKRMVRDAKQRLINAITRASRGDTKGYYGDVAAALTTVLESRLGEAIGGYTHAGLRARLSQRGMRDELASQVVSELEACDFLRFGSAGTSPEAIKEHSGRIRELFQRVQEFTPTPPETKT
jgi:hypothetical protein